MLDRIVSPCGIVYYESPLLRSIGVRHAFSTRIGGSSAAPFDSLNMGNPNGAAVQDDYENIWSNYRRLQEAIGCGGRELCRVHQVHGPAIAQVHRGEPFDVSVKADALVGDDPGRVLSVRVADCVPVLMATGDGQVAAAVHAGWRGVIAGVATAALRAMCELNGDHSGVAGAAAAIGPSIGFEAFEVGADTLTAFREAFGADAPIEERPGGKGRVDLKAALRLQLMAAGMSGDRIDVSDRCTHRDRDEFFSHRRDNGLTGRMAGLIQPGGVQAA